jgi:hypothetical protein
MLEQRAQIRFLTQTPLTVVAVADRALPAGRLKTGQMGGQVAVVLEEMQQEAPETRQTLAHLKETMVEVQLRGILVVPEVAGRMQLEATPLEIMVVQVETELHRALLVRL